MMISTKLQALRRLFSLHERVAILPSANEADSNVSAEQNHLAHRYAQAYRQSYQSILWLDASNAALLRLSCLHACANLGLASDLDPCLQIQQWLRQQSDSLLILEHVRSPQLLSAFSRHGQHVLICSPLQRWPSRAPRSALLRLHGEALQTCSTMGEEPNLHDIAQQLQQLAQLSAPARATLCTFAQLAPLPLPLSVFTSDEQLAAKTELTRYKILNNKRWQDEYEQSWPSLSLAPNYQQNLRLAIFAEALCNDTVQNAAAQHESLAHTLTYLRNGMTRTEQAIAWRSLWRRHVDYFLAHHDCPPQAAAQLLLLLEALYQDQPKTAEVLLRRALHLLEHDVVPSAESLHCRNFLAQNLKRQGRLDEAQVWLVESLQMAHHHDCEKTLARCFLLSNLARLFAQRGQHLAALELEQQALHLLRQRLPDADPHVQAVMQNLAHSLQQVAANEKSEILLQELVTLHIRLFGEDDLRSQALMDQLAANLFQQHKIREAVYWMERVLRARSQLFGTNHVETSIAAYELMCLHCECEEGAAAYQIYEEYLLWLQKAKTPVLHEQQRQIRHLLRDFLPNSMHDGALAGSVAPPVPHILH